MEEGVNGKGEGGFLELKKKRRRMTDNDLYLGDKRGSF